MRERDHPHPHTQDGVECGVEVTADRFNSPWREYVAVIDDNSYYDLR